MIKNISNLGDAGVYIDFGKDVNESTNTEVISYFNHFLNLGKEKKIDGIKNLIPSYNKLVLSFDINVTNFKTIKKAIENLKIKKNKTTISKKIKIPICCDNVYALDFNRLTKKLNLSKEEILNLFLKKEYFCYMTGFIAGMPFLGDVDKLIRVKRHETPRVTVPKGSVAMTEQFSNIYTQESPGGWNIIGNTPMKFFDKSNSKNPTLVKPGDKIKFYKISKEEYLNWNE